MASNHPRNVRGMHRAPRCQAATANGRACRAPAISGKKRCHNHGGKGSKCRSHRQQLTDYSKANLERDSLIDGEIRNLDKGIRRLERAGVAPNLIDPFRQARQQFLRITQQKQADLAASYVPSEAERVAEREKAEALAATRLYSPPGSRSIQLVRDRAQGAMLGLAVGEAVGVTTDGWERDTCRSIPDLWGGGKLQVKRGEWAGDTAMALALMESLTFRQNLDETDLMDRFEEMVDEGVYSPSGSCVGLGKTTKEAIARYRNTGDPIAGDASPDNLDTGSLVRIAPVAIRYWNDPAQRRDVAKRQSLTTHGNQFAASACIAFADVLADLVGSPTTDLLGGRHIADLSPRPVVVCGEWNNKGRSQISSTNNVLTALEAAIWCVGKTETFEDAVLLAANLGEDAGTISALTGQLAGAFYGACDITICWLEQLAWRDKIVDMTDALFDQSQTRPRMAHR